MVQHSVAVIGAGLSGLIVAYRLLQKGVDVHVYEARQRVGGRILTALLNDYPIELGAQNILDGGKAENLQKLISDLQLITESGAIKSRFHYYDGSELIDIDEIIHQSQVLLSKEALKMHLKNMKKRAKNMAEILQSVFPSHPQLYKHFARRLMGFEGLDVEILSPCYAEQLEEMLLSYKNSPHKGGQDIEYKVVRGGNALLAEKMKEKLHDRITLGKPLRALEKTPENSYKLIFSGELTVEAERVVLAFPCSVYQDIDFGPEVLLHSRLQQIKSVSYGEHAKIFVPVHIPENVDGIYVNDRFGTYSMATPNIVTMYYLNHHTSFIPLTLQQVFKRDLSFLEMVYQDRLISHHQITYARCEHFTSYQGALGYNWFYDPYSRGSYSCMAAGQEVLFSSTTEYKGEAAKTLFYPIDNRLFFAGEHASILVNVTGTMEAAVEAGERTARMIGSALVS